MKIYTTLLALVLAAGFSSAFALGGHPISKVDVVEQVASNDTKSDDSGTGDDGDGGDDAS